MATIDQRIYDGDRAREVLTNEAFEAAFNAVQAEITTALMTSPVRDIEGREKLYLMYQMGNKFKSALQSMLQDGEIAKLDLDYEESLFKKLKKSLAG